MLTGVSLFAGVGGFDLAMQRKGVKVVASVEIDNKCNEVLAKHFPEATQFTDVTTVKGEDLINVGFNPSKGIITGGFPCQDLSVAGKRAGLAGERSGLFWEIARLVEETQTEYFVIENVPGLLTSNKGRDFGVVIGTMADLGYSLGWRVLDAQHFGVPQRRRRVFIVGRRSSNSSSPAEILFKSDGLRRDLASSKPPSGARPCQKRYLMRWYTKSRRAQSVDDYETWVEGNVMPTLNAFDNGDVRTTVLLQLRSLHLPSHNTKKELVL
jgi:DNA (cytosine-5)-methyltransferase 1